MTSGDDPQAMAESFKDRLLLGIVSRLGPFFLRVLGLSLRIKEDGVPGLSPRQSENHKAIYAVWHSRMLAGVYYYRNLDIRVLVSMSRDGELISRVVENCGFKSIRGSVSRGGAGALRKMLEALEAGKPVVVTPDGPKGPERKVQDGIIFLAQQSGLPVYPIAFNSSRGIRFKSWDKFLLPLPFSRGVFIWGNPVTMAKDADSAEQGKKKQELENELNRITDRADHYFEKK